MRTYALVAAALAVGLTTGCKDRDRDDTSTRVDATADSAGAEVREGAHDVGNAADTAGDKVGDAVRDVGNATEDAARQATGTWTWDRRKEYREEAANRLAGLDRQLAEARETRRHVGAELDRLGRATESDWTEVRDKFRASIDSLAHQLEALQPDAQPMGGAGPK